MFHCWFHSIGHRCRINQIRTRKQPPAAHGLDCSLSTTFTATFHAVRVRIGTEHRSIYAHSSPIATPQSASNDAFAITAGLHLQTMTLISWGVANLDRHNTTLPLFSKPPGINSDLGNNHALHWLDARQRSPMYCRRSDRIIDGRPQNASECRWCTIAIDFNSASRMRSQSHKPIISEQSIGKERCCRADFSS